MAQNLMTVHDVAERLNVKPCTVYKLFHRGALPGVRIKESNALRFKSPDVNALVETRSKKKKAV